jgi:hypothetical protein
LLSNRDGLEKNYRAGCTTALGDLSELNGRVVTITNVTAAIIRRYRGGLAGLVIFRQIIFGTPDY